MKRLIILLAVLVGACGGNEASPAIPLTGEALIVAGEDSYQRFCAACHGADLRGSDQGPSLLSIVYEPSHHSDFAFVSASKNGAPAHHWGFGDMPAIPGISDAEIGAVTAYVRSVQEAEGFDE
ncbi:MAG: cytochrome c [Acidimicrobiia bacterium]|nr:cytochrome c [Acidimicrobiia bacterium]MDH5421120.1 cytochrome c [Acidimicrobiia bacterium]MDH5503895.1 cytochrome c [Acidimicrobiia bacterium]